MTTAWSKCKASEVRPGERVRVSGDELIVNRIETSFLGNADLLAFIEDTPQRWYKRPVRVDSEVEVELAN